MKKTAKPSPGKLAKAVGLPGLAAVTEYTGLGASTLHQWATTRPQLLQAVIIGTACQVLPSCAELPSGCCLRARVPAGGLSPPKKSR